MELAGEDGLQAGKGGLFIGVGDFALPVFRDFQSAFCLLLFVFKSECFGL